MTVNPLAARAFDAAAEDYERGRPGWPPEVVAALVDRFAATTVLDLAAGTGKLTQVLAPLADVIAVEPVAGMRRVLRGRLPEVRTVDGTAEAIPLGDASVDAVFVAEAFHWFDQARAIAEIARVLRPGGGLALLWNRPDEPPAWAGELFEVVMRHRSHEGAAYTRDDVRWRAALEADGRFEAPADEQAPHLHHTNREELVANIASFSSIAGLDDERRAAALAEVRAVLERHGVEELAFPYTTQITTTRRRG